MEEGDVKQNNLVAIHDLLGLKAVGEWGSKIIDRVSDAFGFLVRHSLSDSIARKEAQSRLTLANAETEAEVYRRVMLARADAVIANEAALSKSPEGRALVRSTLENVRQQSNLENVMRFAIEYAQEREARGETTTADRDVDPDWLEDFKDVCKNTSSAEMQRLWGRVLAQQVGTGSAYTSRDLVVLKTLTGQEAELFRRACQLIVLPFEAILVLGNPFSTVEGRYYGFTYDDVLALTSLGLVTSPTGSQRAVRLNGPAVLPVNVAGKVLHFAIQTPTQVEIRMDAIPFSATGKRLAQLIDKSPPPQYVDAVRQSLEQRGLQFLA